MMTTVWPFATNLELLNRAILATDDQERVARTLLAAMVAEGMAKDFAVYVGDNAPAKSGEDMPALRLVGASRDRKGVA
jgi:hypothetical protein